MHLSTLSQWLEWITTIHSTDIELGLERIKQVGAKLNVLAPSCPVITVGGTNGKGSCVAGLEAIYRAAGYQVGAFTSPVLHRHNEQVRINGIEATDEAFCTAFQLVEAARGNVPLTPFEFTTLAALIIFNQHPLDVLILEVGLGGRLDAVNIIDANVAMIASIDLDHTDWLGATREAIAYEKAGICRPNRPLICGDFNPPHTLFEQAALKGAPLYCQGIDFSYHETGTDWSWTGANHHYDHLPKNMLAVQNMAVVLMAVTLLQPLLYVAEEAIKAGLKNVSLPGRIQIIMGAVTMVYDVSHNPAAAAFLAKRLSTMPCQGNTYAVFSMLADKDIEKSIEAIKDNIDIWYAAPLSVKRAASLETLSHAFRTTQVKNVQLFQSITEAYQAAKLTAKAGDRIIVFGSFHTVSQVMAEVEREKKAK